MNHPDWLKEKKVVFPIQIGAKRDRDLPGIPLWTEVAKTQEQRQILRIIAAPIALGRPFLAPPDVPADRIALLRKAIAQTLDDRGFRDDAAKQKLEIVPMTAEEVTEIVKDTVTAPRDILAKAKLAMDPKAK